MEKLEFKIDINAPKQKVWDTMLHPEKYKLWAGASWPGSFYKGNWNTGETIDFISPDGSGTRALIKEVIPQDSISSVHVGILQKGGIEDTTSEVAKSWIGITENYALVNKNGGTELIIDIHADSQWSQMFNSGFPAALKKLKAICEEN